MVTTKQSARTNPLQALAALAASDQSSRATAREANRARWPLLAEMVDRIPGAKIVWAKDANGEIGKRPQPDAWETQRYDEVMRSLDVHYATTKRGKR